MKVLLALLVVGSLLAVPLAAAQGPCWDHAYCEAGIWVLEPVCIVWNGVLGTTVALLNWLTC